MRCAALRCDGLSNCSRFSFCLTIFHFAIRPTAHIFFSRCQRVFSNFICALHALRTRNVSARALPWPPPGLLGHSSLPNGGSGGGHHRHHDQHHHHPVRAIWPFEKATFQPYFFLLSIWRCQLWSFFIGLLMRNPPMLPPSSSSPSLLHQARTHKTRQSRHRHWLWPPLLPLSDLKSSVKTVFG